MPDSIDELLGHENTRVMIVDFGLAKSVPADGPRAEREDRIMGTPAFMAPEQAEGRAVDHRADIYGLGATLFRLLTGHEPFKADTPLEVLQMKLKTDFPDVSEHEVRISPECRRVLNTMTAPQAADRYQDYRDLVRDLETLVERRGAGRIRRWILGALGPRAWIAAFVAVALLCLAAALLVRGNTAGQDLSNSLGYWSGSTNGWRIAPSDDTVEEELALICNSPGERLVLGHPVLAGSDLAFRMRLPGNGEMDVLLMSGRRTVWTLRWTRTNDSTQLQAGPVDALSDPLPRAAKELPEWYSVRLRTSPDQVVLYLDETLADYGTFDPPVDRLTLAFQLNNGQMVQVKDVWVTPPN